jgi:Fe-S-cluster-containing hydrogenase component 2
MLNNYLEVILSSIPKGTLSIHKGSCARHRFVRSDCRCCFDVCPSGALTRREGELHWNPDQCQGCLVCSAVCPTGALCSDDVSYVSLLKKIDSIERPVLACTGQPKSQGHARLPCLGALANAELLLALSLALGRPIRLNMTSCVRCHNSSVIPHLEKTVQKLPEGISVDLIFTRASLDFEERPYSRREFFGLIRRRSEQTDTCIADRIQIDKPPSDYVTKRLPASRDLLLQVVDQFPDVLKSIADPFWTHLHFNDNCQSCNTCVAICPTGALSASDVTGDPPVLNPEQCVGCRLCETFCTHSSVKVLRSQ